MVVEILVTEGCPNEDAAIGLVGMAASVLEMTPRVILVEVADLAEAQQHNFAGSPTIRIDGCDVAPPLGEEVTYRAEHTRRTTGPAEYLTSSLSSRLCKTRPTAANRDYGWAWVTSRAGLGLGSGLHPCIWRGRQGTRRGNPASKSRDALRAQPAAPLIGQPSCGKRGRSRSVGW
jgi:hypothetical protein